MAKIANDGSVKVTFVPGASGIANIIAPTTAELGAAGAKDLQSNISSDGLDISPSQAQKDTSTLDTTFDTTEPGRKSGSATLTYFCDDNPALDNANVSLAENTLGFLVVRRNGSLSSVAYASAQKVEVYPVVCGAQLPVKTAPNTDKQRLSLLTFRAAWALDAAIA